MNRIYKKIFLYSLYLYLGSTMYTRMKDSEYSFPGNVLYSLPLDAFPLKYIEGKRSISIQIGVLSASETENLLRTNPNTFPNCHAGTTLKQIGTPEIEREYVIVRFKNKSSPHYGDVKLYYSYFPYSIKWHMSLSGLETNYYNIVLPYFQELAEDSKTSPEASVRWKNFL